MTWHLKNCLFSYFVLLLVWLNGTERSKKIKINDDSVVVINNDWIERIIDLKSCL